MHLRVVCIKSSSPATFAGIVEISGTVQPALFGVPHYNSCITSNKQLGLDFRINKHDIPSHLVRTTKKNTTGLFFTLFHSVYRFLPGLCLFFQKTHEHCLLLLAPADDIFTVSVFFAFLSPPF